MSRLTRPLPQGFGPGYLLGMFTMLLSVAISIPLWIMLNPSDARPAGDPVPHYYPVCETEDGGPNLPCVWRDSTPDGFFILYTDPS